MNPIHLLGICVVQYRRSLNVIKVCICNDSSLIRVIKNYGIIHFFAITFYFDHIYTITVVLKTLLAVRLIALFIIVRFG